MEDEDEDAVGWWQPEEEDSADSDCDGHASTHGDAGGAYAVQWAPPRDTDLRELETGVGEVDGWRCRLEERLAACRRHVDGGREVCEGLAKVSARVKEEADVIRTRERRLNEAVARCSGEPARARERESERERERGQGRGKEGVE